MSALTDSLEQIWDAQLDCYDPSTVNLTIGGVAADYACDAGELRETNTLAIGGLIDEPTLQVGIKRSLLPSSAHPPRGTLAVYLGKTFKVMDCRTSPDNTVVILDLEPKNAGK